MSRYNKRQGNVLKDLPRLNMPDDPKEYQRIYMRFYRAHEEERMRIATELGLLRRRK